MLDDNPIFIGGDGRSGTTLLNVILDCHPKLSVAPELHFTGDKIVNLGPYALQALEFIRGGGRLPNGQRAVDTPEWKPGIQFVLRTQRTGLTIDEIESCIYESIASTNSDLEEFSDRCDLVQRLGQTLQNNDQKERWGFKIMKEIRNPLKYMSIWKNCQIIHIIRDGRDVAASQMTDHGSWGYNQINKAAENWVKLIKSARNNSKNISYYELRYEDLVSNTLECVHGICDFIDVDFDASMMQHQKQIHRFYKTKVAHPSRKRTMKAVDNRAIGRYKQDLTQEEIEVFETTAGEMLESLQYKLTAMPGATQ